MALRREKKDGADGAARWAAWALCAGVFAGTLCVFALVFLSGAGFVASGLPFIWLASAVVGWLFWQAMRPERASLRLKPTEGSRRKEK